MISLHRKVRAKVMDQIQQHKEKVRSEWSFMSGKIRQIKLKNKREYHEYNGSVYIFSKEKTVSNENTISKQ